MATGLAELLDETRFDRLLVIGGAIPDIVSSVGRLRTAPEAELPMGLYWFSGVDSTLVMVVNAGVGTGDSAIVDVNALTDDSPLAAAYDWAESFWDDGAAVPAPRFGVSQAVVTRASGRDTEVRSRRRGSSSPTRWAWARRSRPA
ncbi:MAG: hypothetical protein AB7V44_02005 [Pseudonocardia sp.]